jgi:hypothetical protein
VSGTKGTIGDVVDSVVVVGVSNTKEPPVESGKLSYESGIPSESASIFAGNPGPSNPPYPGSEVPTKFPEDELVNIPSGEIGVDT